MTTSESTPSKEILTSNGEKLTPEWIAESIQYNRTLRLVATYRKLSTESLQISKNKIEEVVDVPFSQKFDKALTLFAPWLTSTTKQQIANL